MAFLDMAFREQAFLGMAFLDRAFPKLVLSCEEPLLAMFYRTVSLDLDVSPTPREVNFITELTQ